MKHITYKSIVRHLIGSEYIIFKNVLLKVLNTSDIIGRHSFNKNNDSYVRIFELDENDEEYATYKSDKNLASLRDAGWGGNLDIVSFFSHYCMGFGHCLHAMMSTYSSYLNNKTMFGDYKMLHFDGAFHISQLNMLISDIEEKEIVKLENGDNIFIRNLAFFRTSPKPDIMSKMGIKIIKDYIIKNKFKTALTFDRICIMKTSGCKDLDNKQNPRGNINHSKILSIMEINNINVINHATLNTCEIIYIISSCNLLVTNWGATSAWHIFLGEESKCYCIVPKTYWHEVISIKYKDLCFSEKIFKNYVISKIPVENDLTASNIQQIKNEIRALC